MVLKWKLGNLVWTDFLPLKRNSFSSTPPFFDSTVITLSRDIVHKFEKLTLQEKVYSFYYIRFLLLSFSCFLTGYLIGRDPFASFSCFHKLLLNSTGNMTEID